MTIEVDHGERSYAAIDAQDLARLSVLARCDFNHYMARQLIRRSNFAAQMLCVTLCQGAAQHYLWKQSGVKDFDVFTFFAAAEGLEFPARRRTSVDFGPSRFGRNPEDIGYEGRRVDLMGRSIAHTNESSIISSVRRYLRSKPGGVVKCVEILGGVISG